LDVSHVQRPLTSKVSAGVASTHGLTLASQEPVTAAGRNKDKKFKPHRVISNY